ncbi:MAG: MFS transporter, partial [Acidovorax sp.]
MNHTATPSAVPQGWMVARLGTAQTLAWASSYYLPAMLAEPMARDLGVSSPTVFAAFSVALIVSALLAPLAGRAIDVHGGRPVLVGASLVFAAALAGMALAQGPVGLFAAWMLLGVAMGCGLYEAAFAALVRLYGQNSRGAITGITLVAGFASTVGWPLSAWMESHWGWRGACMGWAGLHLLLGLPLNLWLPRAVRFPMAAGNHTPAAQPAADDAVNHAAATDVSHLKEALHNPREDALVRIGIGHKALFADNSMAIGKKSNAVDCPSPGPRRPQGV